MKDIFNDCYPYFDSNRTTVASYILFLQKNVKKVNSIYTEPQSTLHLIIRACWKSQNSFTIKLLSMDCYVYCPSFLWFWCKKLGGEMYIQEARWLSCDGDLDYDSGKLLMNALRRLFCLRFSRWIAFARWKTEEAKIRSEVFYSKSGTCGWYADKCLLEIFSSKHFLSKPYMKIKLGLRANYSASLQLALRGTFECVIYS